MLKKRRELHDGRALTFLEVYDLAYGIHSHI